MILLHEYSIWIEDSLYIHNVEIYCQNYFQKIMCLKRTLSHYNVV